MRFSEAMRLGAMALPRVKNSHAAFEVDSDGNICAGCAVASAAFVVGIGRDHEPWPFCEGEWIGETGRLFPILNTVVPWPVEANADFMNPYRKNVGQIASGLFVTWGWTRERIADWVETIERAQEPQVVCVPVAATEHSAEQVSAAQESF